MSTIKEIIARVDEAKPNAFPVKLKMGWLSELDGKIAADVMLMSIVEIRGLQYKHPEHLEAELLLTYPHESVYEHYLEAKIDYANGEYNKYQNSMEMFNAAYSNFVCWFAGTYDPAQGYRREGTGYVF